MIGKVVVSAISLILVVGVVIGVVASVHRSTTKTVETPQMKAVTQICQPTNYKETCTEALSSANTTDPKELIKAGILAISDSLSRSLKLSQGLVGEAVSEPRTKLALQDCNTLLKNASDGIEDILARMAESQMQSIAEHADDFRIWLSSIISYQELCMDGFQHNGDIKSTVQNSTDYGNKLTDNVLTILAAISNILQDFGLQFNPPKNSRRLLGADGYPTWLTAGHRKLMAGAGPAPNAVVAQDGSGQFKSISAAINSYRPGSSARFVVHVKAGTYNEQILVPKTHSNVFMYGDGPDKTIITGKKSFASGVNTWNTAPFVVEGPGFICKNMGFQNTAGPSGHQACSIRVNSDMSVFHNCKFDGYQDTLLYQAGRQYYGNCVITGTVDFLFGYGAAVIQNSQIIVRKPNKGQKNTVTADGRKEKGQNTGLVIHNCKIIPEPQLVPERLTVKTYLGRPWKQFSTTVVMQTELGDLIQPEGWMPWDGNLFLNSIFYAEYANTGAGANTANRVKWKTLHFLNPVEAQRFTVGTFLPGSGQWIKTAGVPFLLGFR